MVQRTVLLLRHATTEDFRPGFQDRDRRLTERGVSEAEAVGSWLRAQCLDVDQVVCSTAVRTRQTLDGLGLSTPVEFADSLYAGDTDLVLRAVRELDDDTTCGLIIGHAPTIPAAVRELADPATSDPEALATLARRYPPATLSALRFTAPWPDATHGRLTTLRLP